MSGTVADLSPAARYQRRNVLLVEEDTAGETGNQRGRGWDSRGECFVDSVLSFCHHVSVLLLSTKIGGEGRGGEGGGEREKTCKDCTPTLSPPVAAPLPRPLTNTSPWTHDCWNQDVASGSGRTRICGSVGV